MFTDDRETANKKDKQGEQSLLMEVMVVTLYRQYRLIQQTTEKIFGYVWVGIWKVFEFTYKTADFVQCTEFHKNFNTFCLVLSTLLKNM